MKRLIQGFIAGIVFTTVITGLALSNKNSVTAIKSRMKKGAENLKEKAKRSIKVEGDTDDEETDETSPSATPKYPEPETAEAGTGTSYKRRSEERSYRKTSQS